MFLLLFPYSKRRFYYNRNALFVQSAMESIRFYILIRNHAEQKKAVAHLLKMDITIFEYLFVFD